MKTDIGIVCEEQNRRWKDREENEKAFVVWCKKNGTTPEKFLDRVKEGVVAQYYVAEEELGRFMPYEANMRYVVLPLYSPVANRLKRYGWNVEKINDLLTEATMDK